MNGTRVLIADDHSLILKGIKSLIEAHYEVVGTADNGKMLVSQALKLKPELIVLDVSMPIVNGIDAAREIKKELPSTKFVFLSMHSNAIYLRKAFEMGAAAYVLKTGASEELLTAIEDALKGRQYISPGFSPDVINNLGSASEKATRAVIEMTTRQRQILQLIAEGKQNKEIADILCVSVKTIEFHRSRLMAKLGAHTIAELTRFALQEGLISPAE